MIRRPPRSTRTDTLFPYTTLFRSRGFVANIDEITAETRKGRQVVNLKPQSKLKIVRPIPANADFVAAIGDNRKLVVFPLSELPEMARGQGVQLQRRSEERRVGKGGVSTGRVRWEPGHDKKKP